MPSPLHRRAQSREDAEALAPRARHPASTPSPSATCSTPTARRWRRPSRAAPRDVTEENLQARIRGNFLMALSNKFGWLVLTTGNKSEISVGYSTLYGDMAGGFAVLKDVLQDPGLPRWRATATRRGAGHPASARSRGRPRPSCGPTRRDQDTLPPYEVLDPILEAYVEEDRSAAEIVAAGPRRGDGAARDPHGGRGTSTSAARPAGHEDHAARLRPRPPAADHEPLAGMTSSPGPRRGPRGLAAASASPRSPRRSPAPASPCPPGSSDAPVRAHGVEREHAVALGLARAALLPARRNSAAEASQPTFFVSPVAPIAQRAPHLDRGLVRRDRRRVGVGWWCRRDPDVHVHRRRCRRVRELAEEREVA